jgi:hypothetical protein
MGFIGMFGGIVVLVLVSMLGLAALIIGASRLMGGWFRGISGWDALAKAFPGPAEIPDGTRTGPVRIGNVYFRYGPRFCPTPQGFYMVYKSVYSYPPLLIPWSEFRDQKHALLFWRSARRMDIGSPVITSLTLLENTCTWISPYLSAAASPHKGTLHDE